MYYDVININSNFKLSAEDNQAFVIQYTDQVDVKNTHLFNQGETSLQIRTILQKGMPQMKQRLQQSELQINFCAFTCKNDSIAC